MCCQQECRVTGPPHSPRNFPPSKTSSIGRNKDESDYLGGWCAEGTGTQGQQCTRFALSNKAVISAIVNESDGDNLAESESVPALEEKMTQWTIPEEERSRVLVTLSRSAELAKPRSPSVSGPGRSPGRG